MKIYYLIVIALAVFSATTFSASNKSNELSVKNKKQQERGDFFKYVDKRSCIEFRLPMELKESVEYNMRVKYVPRDGETEDEILDAQSNFYFKNKFSLSFTLSENSDSKDFDEFIDFKKYSSKSEFSVDGVSSFFDKTELMYDDEVVVSEDFFIPIAKERTGLSPNYLSANIHFGKVRKKPGKDEGFEKAKEDLPAIREFISEFKKNIHYVKCEKWPEVKKK